MPEMDGFELLAYFNTYSPSMPVVVMTAFATSETGEPLSRMGSPRILEKPVDFDELAREIGIGFAQESRGGSLAGISISNFLQLIEMEKKICAVHERNEKGDAGCFYFDQRES